MFRVLSKFDFLWEKKIFLLLMMIGWFIFPFYLFTYYVHHKLYLRPFYRRKYYFILLIALMMSLWHQNYLGIYGAMLSFVGIECALFVGEEVTVEAGYQLLDSVLQYSIIPVLVIIVEIWLFRGCRVLATFQNANFLGLVYVFLGVYSLFRFLSTKEKQFVGYYLLSLGTVFISQSRSMLVVIALVSAILWIKFYFSRFKVLTFFLFTGLLMYLLGILVFNFPFIRMESLVGDLTIRQSIFVHAGEAIARSWLFGYGNHYYETISRVHNYYYTYHAHNLFLESLLSYGVVGTMGLWYLCWQYYRQTNFMGKMVMLIVFLVGILDVGIFWHQTGILGFLMFWFFHRDQQITGVGDGK